MKQHLTLNMKQKYTDEEDRIEMMNYLSNQSLEQEEGIADKLIVSKNLDNIRIPQ